MTSQSMQTDGNSTSGEGERVKPRGWNWSPEEFIMVVREYQVDLIWKNKGVEIPFLGDVK